MSPAPDFSLDLLIEQPRIQGVVIGLIAQTTGDPDQLNRVKVNFPTLQVGSAWARVASFFAGPDRGAFFFPQTGDEVLVVFEQGDPAKPYVIGMLWNGVDKPPVPAEQTATLRMIKTSGGAVIKIDDADGSAGITIVDKNNNSVVIDTKNNKITVTSSQDISLSAPSGTISLQAQTIQLQGGDVQITAQQGKLALSGSAEATLQSGGEISVNGSMIRLN